MKVFENIIDLDPAFPFQINRYELRQEDNRDEVYHWHSCLEITYIEKGSATYFVNAYSFDAAEGDFILFNSAEPHGWTVNSKTASVLAMVFSSDFISGKPESFEYRYLAPFLSRGSSFLNKISSKDRDAETMAAIVREIFSEYRRRETGWNLMVKADVLRFLTFLMRSYTSDETVSEIDLSEKTVAMRQLEKVFLYVYRHYPEKIMLADMAALSNMSPAYFSRRFRQLTGRTFSDYLIDVRLGHARQMLRESKTDVASAAMDCGFANLSNFYRLYRKHLGSAPGSDRRASSQKTPNS